MEALALVLIGLVMYVHGWHLLGLTESRSTGIVGAVVGIALAALVLYKPVAAATGADPGLLAALLLLGAVYALLVAAVGLWDFDARTLGFYSIFLAVSLVVIAVYFGSVEISTMLAVAAGVLAVPFALLFFHLVPPFRRIGVLTGWFFLVLGAAAALIGYGVYLNLIDLTI